VAVVAGVLLAGCGLFAFNRWLDQFVADHAQEDVELGAKRKLALAENRIGRVIATLDGIAHQKIETCRPAHLEALRKAVFSNVMIKEISVVGPQGQTLCTTSGLGAGSARLLSSYRTAFAPNVSLEVFTFDGASEKILRIRRSGNAETAQLDALLLGSTLIAQSSPEGTGPTGHARMTMANGTVIGESGTPLDTGEASLTASLSSDRYGLNISVTLPDSALQAHAIHIKELGLAFVALLSAILAAFRLLGRRRQRDNPIAEMERALEAGEFVPYYQPVVDLVTGKLRGAEVLIRWRKPDGTILSPAAFIPLAESSGIIIEMTRALMRRVCQEIGPAYAQRPHLKIAFNLAARHFEDDTIVRDVRQIFGRGSLCLSQLVLELTERQPIENLAETRRLIATLQGFGVRMAIDDVGTGHCGLSYILKLGVDIIKIDKMFVDAIGIERSSTAIIETLVDLAHNMRMDIVAEGVETFEQVVCLRERGIRAAQGFVFAPPLPGSAFLQLVEAIEPGAAAAPAVPIDAVGLALAVA
jgi:sensor c-di-GMP phosphodiesterase-like protein